MDSRSTFRMFQFAVKSFKMSFLARKDNSKIFNFSLKKVLNSLGRKFWIIWNIWNEFRQSRDNSGNVVAGKKRILVKKEDLPSLLDSKLLLWQIFVYWVRRDNKGFFPTCVMLESDWTSLILKTNKNISKVVHTFIRCQTSGLSNLAQTWHSLQKKGYPVAKIWTQ